MNITKEWLEEEYVNKGRSFQDIADELKTYANAIRRKAIKFGIKPRDKSAAQSNALMSGRHKHPTKGTKRSDEVKVLISEGVAKSWENLSDEERDSRIEQARENWWSMTDVQRDAMQKSAISAIRKTSKEGSTLEKYLFNLLKRDGFLIEFHKKNFVSNANLEVDMFIPTHNIAIEVDGPSHFEPIWGEEALQKTIKADMEKNGLLNLYNITVIRLRQKRKNLSMKYMSEIYSKLLLAIHKIIENPGQEKILIVEV